MSNIAIINFIINLSKNINKKTNVNDFEMIINSFVSNNVNIDLNLGNDNYEYFNLFDIICSYKYPNISLYQKEKLLSKLIELGSNINILVGDNYYKQTVLTKAVQFKDTQLCSYLINLGANPNIKNDDQTTSLDLAIKLGHTDIIDLFINFNKKSVKNTKKRERDDKPPVILSFKDINFYKQHIGRKIKYIRGMLEDISIIHSIVDFSVKLKLENSEEFIIDIPSHITFLSFIDDKIYIQETKNEPNYTPIQKDYVEKINKLNLSQSIKDIAMEKINSLDSNPFSSSNQSNKSWLDTFIKIPFDTYSSFPINKSMKKDEIGNYFKMCIDTLDEVSYGMENVKEEILDLVSHIISTDNKGMPRIIGIQGSPGVGKTSFVRRGLAKILNKPFQSINMGGISDSSYLLGHQHTYVSSKPGMIVQSLINSKCMNPILFMDELDKVSESEKGREIQNVLIHVTDPVQNNNFQDKYFSEINFDISKMFIIFSYNDINKVHPILRDRIYTIKVKNPTIDDKVKIGKNYLIKEICSNLNLDDVDINENLIKDIIQNYCKNDIGLRSLKKCLETIYLKINTARFNPYSKYNSLKNLQFPFKVTKKVIEECLTKDKDENEFYNSLFI